MRGDAKNEVQNELYCDHCGKVLDTMIDFDDTQIDIAHKWTTANLCAECLDKLYDLVRDFCEVKGSKNNA